ncbi:MAG: ion channel [Actinomycetota bacterium]
MMQEPTTTTARRARGVLARVRGRLRLRGTLALLFACAVVLQFGYPITLLGTAWTAAYMVLYAGMLFFALLIVHEARAVRVPLIVVGLLSATTGVVYAFLPDSTPITLLMLGSVAAFMAGIIIVLARFLFRRTQEDGLTLILAALTIYVILGGLFGALYAGIEQLFPGSFSDPLTPGQSPTWVQLVYFSYVVMSTIGFGDVLATTPWSRTLVTFHGVAATLFLTIVVARLVGIWSSSPAEKKAEQ